MKALVFFFCAVALCNGQRACPLDARICNDTDRTAVGRDANNNCDFFLCPGALCGGFRPAPIPSCAPGYTCQGDGLAFDAPGNCKKEVVRGCTKDAKRCPDGTVVGRDINNNCSWFLCPGDQCGGLRMPPIASCPAGYQCVGHQLAWDGPGNCRAEVQQGGICGGGNALPCVSGLECRYADGTSTQPSTEATGICTNTSIVRGCTKDAKRCPDGTVVGRDINNNCSWFLCPGDQCGGFRMPPIASCPAGYQCVGRQLAWDGPGNCRAEVRQGGTCGGVDALPCVSGLECRYADGTSTQPSTEATGICRNATSPGPCATVRCAWGSCQVVNNRAKCVCPEICNAIADPRCGTDGNTYGNSCELSIKTCQTQGGVTELHAGVCKEEVVLTQLDPSSSFVRHYRDEALLVRLKVRTKINNDIPTQGEIQFSFPNGVVRTREVTSSNTFKWTIPRSFFQTRGSVVVNYRFLANELYEQSATNTLNIQVV